MTRYAKEQKRKEGERSAGPDRRGGLGVPFAIGLSCVLLIISGSLLVSGAVLASGIVLVLALGVLTVA